jgi:hypothetical protein
MQWLWSRAPCAPSAAWSASALVLLLAVSPARADRPTVPYVPTPQEVVQRMLELAKVGPADYVIDLGSGDGRIVITAAKAFGARGFGVDLNPDRIREANENAREAGVTDRVAFHQRNLFDTDLGDATVITMYLLPRVNIQLRPKLLELAPGTRIVSHDFSMEDWEPDAHIVVDSKDRYGSIGGQSDVFLWVIPAKVAGTWRWELPIAGKPRSYSVTLTQQYQEISGSARIGGHTYKLREPRLRGDEIRFGLVAEVDGAPLKHEFSGRVDGDRIIGSAAFSGARVQGQAEWQARRAARSGAPAPGRGVPRVATRVTP